jgi:hypothetical protein
MREAVAPDGVRPEPPSAVEIRDQLGWAVGVQMSCADVGCPGNLDLRAQARVEVRVLLTPEILPKPAIATKQPALIREPVEVASLRRSVGQAPVMKEEK